MARSVFAERNTLIPNRGDRFTAVYSMLGANEGNFSFIFRRFFIGMAIRDSFASQAQLWRVLDVDFRAQDALAFVTVQWEINRESVPGLAIGNVMGDRDIPKEDIQLRLNELLQLGVGDPIGDPGAILDALRGAVGEGIEKIGEGAKAVGGFVIGSIRLSVTLIIILLIAAIVFRDPIRKAIAKGQGR
jgi:hypothetical protein